MCGIVGFINKDGVAAGITLIERMSETLRHRGPDDGACWTRGNVALGHRRLEVIDPTPRAAQPMRSSDDRYVLNYNGEIYNYRELRVRLENEGWVFQSDSDTEVVLAAFAVWGTDSYLEFNGMFALAIWDSLTQRMHLARDRYGVKPLYYAEHGGTFLFSSEIKAMMPHPAFRAAMDPHALVEYLTFQNFFSERTLFKGVQLLPAGTHAVYDAGSGSLHQEMYWDFDFVDGGADIDPDAALEELDRLFCQAVERQMVSDTEIGSYLSGGLDTGSIAAVAAALAPSLKTFTVGFDLSSSKGLEIGFDERAQAEEMSYLFGTEQYETVLKAGDMERVMPALVHHLEEPRVGQSYPNFYAAKLASRFVKVVMCGTGGDEMFGGYPWRYYKAGSDGSLEGFIDQFYLFWQRLIPNSVLNPMVAPIAKEVDGFLTRDVMRNVLTHKVSDVTSVEDCINLSLYFEAKTFLQGLFVVTDKLSMAHGLETRVPFLDNDLVDFAMRMPVSLKLSNLEIDFRQDENMPGNKLVGTPFERDDGKRLLRRMMERHVPKSISNRPKRGFSGPDESWFKNESVDYVRRKLMGKNANIFEFLNRKQVQGVIDEHLSGKANKRLFVWSMLYLEEWCSQNL